MHEPKVHGIHFEKCTLIYAYQRSQAFSLCQKRFFLSLSSESFSLPPFTWRQESFFCHRLVCLSWNLIEMESEHISHSFVYGFYTLVLKGLLSLLTCISISFLFINRIPFFPMDIPQFVHLFSYLWIFVTFKFLVIVKRKLYKYSFIRF